MVNNQYQRPPTAAAFPANPSYPYVDNSVVYNPYNQHAMNNPMMAANPYIMNAGPMDMTATATNVIPPPPGLPIPATATAAYNQMAAVMASNIADRDDC